MQREDLMKFCGKREGISKPWSRGEYTLATNGYLLIRLLRLAEVEEQPKAPEVMEYALGVVFSKNPHAWYPLPAVTVEQKSCPDCKGDGKAFTCPECDGEGEVTPRTDWNDYDEQTCLTCDGAGVLSREDWLRTMRGKATEEDAECTGCNGTGKVWINEPVAIAGEFFSSRLLSLLTGLPNVEIGIFGPLETARIRFDGGDGMIMPRRQ